MKVYDLYCGLGGWSEAFLAEGYECVGFDIEAHEYWVPDHQDSDAAIKVPGNNGPRMWSDRQVQRLCDAGRSDKPATRLLKYPGKLILRDVRSIHGSELKDAAVIVGSSPCQEFSYRAMPWKRAKALGPPYLGMELFNAQFRIQREASEAAGHHIPMVVENVRGAQKWVGRAAWNYGSFYLWGDVPALMPLTLRARKFNPDGTNHGQGSWFAVADSKNRGSMGQTGGHEGRPACDEQATSEAGQEQACSSESKSRLLHQTGRKTPPIPPHPRADFGWNYSPELRDSRKHDGSGWTENGSLASHNRLVSNQPQEGYKTVGMNWSNPNLRGQDFTRIAGKQAKDNFGWSGTIMRQGTSRGKARKAASAMIAKIPYPLALHIARTLKPRELATA